MTWETALSITISDTGTRRYAWLCSDDNPDAAARNAYRQRMLQRANTFPPNQPAPPESDVARAARLIAGEPQPPAYPSLATMAVSAVKAAAGFVASGFAVASEEEQDRRISICHACTLFDPAQGRCTKCGCFGDWKAWITFQCCPVGKW